VIAYYHMKISPLKPDSGPGTGLKPGPGPGSKPGLEVVLKCDSVGSLEAALTALSVMIDTGELGIIHSGLGAISKSDVDMAATGSRLIVGFQVGVLPGTDKLLKEQRVELRLYQVIYALTEDLRALSKALKPVVPEEQVIGSAKVVALFKGSRKGVILGCEVLSGHLSAGQHFRIISVAGPVYFSTITSMHIGDHAIQKALPGQKIGLKIDDFKKVRIGDFVESYRKTDRASPVQGRHGTGA
jgi:translation initiation factor IF-2